MAAVAVGLACALTAYPVVRASSLAPITAPLAGIGLICVVVALVFRGWSTSVALFVLAGQYVLVETTGHSGSLSIVAYAVGLVVLCELLLWASAIPTRGRVDFAVIVALAQTLALIAGAASALAIIAMAAAGLEFPGAYSGAIIGSAAGTLLFGLVLLLIRARR